MKPLITLATLKDATSQEVFDPCARPMLTQNARCQGDCGCAYRNNLGQKCVAGCLISEEEYNKQNKSDGGNEFESYGTWDTVVSAGLATGKHESLIVCLQKIHDETPVNEWKNSLFSLAKEYGLDNSSI